MKKITIESFLFDRRWRGPASMLVENPFHFSRYDEQDIQRWKYFCAPNCPVAFRKSLPVFYRSRFAAVHSGSKIRLYAAVSLLQRLKLPVERKRTPRPLLGRYMWRLGVREAQWKMAKKYGAARKLM